MRLLHEIEIDIQPVIRLVLVVVRRTEQHAVGTGQQHRPTPVVVQRPGHSLTLPAVSFWICPASAFALPPFDEGLEPLQRRHQVGAHRFLGAIRVVLGDRFDHREVLVPRDRTKARAVVVEAEGVQVAAQSRQHVADHLVAGEVGDHRVEGRVVDHVQTVQRRRDRAACPAGPGRAAQFLDLVRLRLGCGLGGQRGFHKPAQLDELSHLLDAHERSHGVATPGLLDDQAVRFHPRQRLAHRRRGDPEGSCKFFDVEPCARFERVGHEHVGDDLVHRTGQRLALSQPLPGGGLMDCFDEIPVHLGLRVSSSTSGRPLS